MCFGRKPEFISETETETTSPAESPVTSSVDFRAIEEALLASPVMQAGFDIDASPVAQATEPDTTEEPGEVVETMEILVISSGPVPPEFLDMLGAIGQQLFGVDPAFLESEPGAVELGPMDTFPFRA